MTKTNKTKPSTVIHTIATFCVDHKAHDVKVYHFTHPLFEEASVVTSVSNTTHLRSLRDTLAKFCAEHYAKNRDEVMATGDVDSGWVLLTLAGEVGVHMMLPATRTFYDLDGLFMQRGSVTIYSSI